MLGAVAHRLTLLVSKCLQCDYIHTLTTEKCVRKEKQHGNKNEYFYWVWAGVSRGMKGKEGNGSPWCSREVPEHTQWKAPSTTQINQHISELAEFAAGRMGQCWCWNSRTAPHTHTALSTELHIPSTDCTAEPAWKSWWQHRKIPLGTCSSPPN